MDFDIEMVVESCSHKKGYIKPGFTKVMLSIDNSLDTPKTFQKLILASIYEEQDSEEDSALFDIDEADEDEFILSK